MDALLVPLFGLLWVLALVGLFRAWSPDDGRDAQQLTGTEVLPGEVKRRVEHHEAHGPRRA